MTSCELAKSIYEMAQGKGKQAWLSDKQNSFLFSLLQKEGRLDDKAKRHFVAYVMPDGSWIKDLTLEQSFLVGEYIKRAYVIAPPFFIKREGFNVQKIVVR